ncbi:MAG: C25 family cysteine peptidase [bacterium]
MKQITVMFALGTGLLALVGPAWGAVGPTTVLDYAVSEEFLPNQCIVSFEPPASGPETPPVFTAEELPAGAPRHWYHLVPLPQDATQYSLRVLTGGDAVTLNQPVAIQTLRGVPVAVIDLFGPDGDAIQVAVQHNGTWNPAARQSERLGAEAFASTLGLSGPAQFGSTTSQQGTGSYVIITAPAYADAVADLADWKRRKGFPVVLVTTDVTGNSNSDIKDWLQTAYDSWDQPPAYVLLVGDVADLPTWTFSGNVSDHPYACLDGDDWLPDIMVGRFSVASAYEAETFANKTVMYERDPYVEASVPWFTRALGVAGNSGSTTPMSTVRWCGEQLESIGFEPAAGVYYAPPIYDDWYGDAEIDSVLEQDGASIVVYRGWAYGIAGWQPPEFTVAHIPGVENGRMTPVVFSIVCHTGDFGHADACFGEVFTRQGTPTAPKGAVAFVGNGEHWSTTRFNDAFAYAYFQEIIDPQITDLGQLMIAGKLKFMEMFPLEYESDNHGEASVEFYFHIYNLLGDPELNFWKSTPVALDGTHVAYLALGANYLQVSVTDEFATPLAGARVGVVQESTLLGYGFSDGGGAARIPLTAVSDGANVAVTVTKPGHIPYEGVINIDDGSTAFVAAATVALDDDTTAPSDGNGDGIVNPGETVEVTVTAANGGSGSATAVSATLSSEGPVTVTPGAVNFPDIPGGGSEPGDTPFVVTLDADVADGTRFLCQLDTEHATSSGDRSQFELIVSAPQLQVESVVLDGDGVADPGETITFSLDLFNSGSAGTAGGNATLILVTDDLASLTDDAAIFGALAPNSSVNTSNDTFSLTVDGDTPEGSGLVFTLLTTSDEGYEATTSFTILVGPQAISIPVGPDNYGYYAYDSADINYPGQMPAYRWTDLSPTFGGTGDEVSYWYDTQLPIVVLPFPFQFYGDPVDTLRVSDNGWVSFDPESNYDWWNLPLPHPYSSHSVVAPFWDNFDPTEPETDGVYTEHDGVAGTFTVQWTRMRRNSSILPENDDLETFQVVFLDPAVHTPPSSGDGEIVFQYKQVTNSDHLYSYASVGIENKDEDDGLQLSYSNLYPVGAAPLSPGLAIKFTTAAPAYVPYDLAKFTAVTDPDGVTLSWTVRDERPVTGWRLARLDDDQPEPAILHEQPLAADARGFIDLTADPTAGCRYLITALHPFGQSTELGPYSYSPTSTQITSFNLLPCWPNPVRGSTTINFALSRTEPVKLRIYDLAGRCVRTLVNGPLPQGPGSLVWDGRDNAGQLAAGGVYLYRLETNKEIRTRKLLLVR